LELRRSREFESESAYEGVVVGMLMDEGQHVDQGMPLLQVELSERQLEALVFVPLEGPRIKQGQTVQLSPEGITWEEYGYMLGTVEAVSDSPMSPDAMARILRNEALVQQFSAAGGVYLVTVKLETTPGAAGQPAQFRWTSSRVPDTRIGTGTLLTAQITVDQRPPIALVIPAIRRWIGI
jgi:HlyD family secretion protein